MLELHVICDKYGIYLQGVAQKPDEIPFGPLIVPNIIATMIDWGNLQGALNHQWVLALGSILSGFGASIPPDDEDAKVLWEAVIRSCAELVRDREEEAAEEILRTYEVMRMNDLVLQPQPDGSYALVKRVVAEPPYDNFGRQSGLFLVDRREERCELITAALADYLGL